MRSPRLSLYRIGLAILSGGVLSLAFPSFNLSSLAWVGLVPLFFALQKSSPRYSFCLGWLCGLTYFGGTLYWIIYTMTLYGHVTLWQSMLIALALIAYLSLYIGCFASLLNWLKPKVPLTDLLLAPLIWTAMEFLRAHLLTGFPWSTLGYSQYLHLPLIQFADITGVYGISFLIVLVNMSIAELLISTLERSFTQKLYSVITALLILAIVEGYGIYKLHYCLPKAERTISLGLVQGNIPQEEKWDSRLQDKVYGIYRFLTLQVAKSKPDLIIWPETSAPFINEQRGEYLENVSPLAMEAHVPMVIGSPRIEFKDGTIQLKNSAFFLSEEGKILDWYDKIHLVPFGEYLPLPEVLAHFGSVVNEVGEFSPGYRYTIFKLDRSSFGLIICYEIIFPSLVRQFIRDGADFMINITNDAWFGLTSAPYQHFSMAIFRAIENGVNIVRVANTGISGIIDPTGRSLGKIPLCSRTSIIKEFELKKIKTFYAQYGDLFAKSCLSLLGVLLILACLHRQRMEE